MNTQEEFWSLLSEIYSFLQIFKNKLPYAVWNKPVS
jgi:hypothetical protein